MTITIPKNISKEGMVVIPKKEYERVLRVLRFISEDQLWFWTKEWQAKEKEADRDIKHGYFSKGYKTKVELKVALDRMKKTP